ncbi:hypothetical protein HNR24_002420 [Nesterenkonia jeotgali]|uniref:Uncharacterized protein n=1 Tax=Nesterenkonia jeotgali TaxID=317018 RepID=A0A839G0K8_9MICC|nr:hypothetical protein [Nesterenkonia jeotgali]
MIRSIPCVICLEIALTCGFSLSNSVCWLLTGTMEQENRGDFCTDRDLSVTILSICYNVLLVLAADVRSRSPSGQIFSCR